MKFALRNRVFFFKVIVGYKMKFKVVEELKTKKILKNENSKNISRTFSGVVDSVGSVHFRIVPCSGLYFPGSIGPFLHSQC